MPQIITSGSINLTGLTDPDLYVVIQQPPSFIRGVPTDVIGVVGTASWGPVNLPVHMGSGQEAQLAFGPISSVSLLDPFDLASDLYLAFGQATSNATLEGWAVRVTDGTDVAASTSLTGAATALPATVTISGTLSAGDVAQLTATSSALAGSPITVYYTIKATDTFATVAAALAAAVNNNSTLAGAAVYASALGAVATIYSPTGLSPAIVWTKTGTAAVTMVIATGSASTAGGTLAALYTGTLGNGVRLAITTSTAVAAAVNVVVSGFSGTAEVFPNIPTANFWRNLQAALAQGQTNFRGPSSWMRLSTINAAVGAPSPGTYTLAGGLDGRSGVNTSAMLGSSTSVPHTGVWAMQNVTPAVGIVWLVGVTDVGAVATMDNFALTAGCSVLFPFPPGTSTTAATSAVQGDGIGGPEFIYVKDNIYWQDTTNNLRRFSLPTPVIGGTWATYSPEQSPLNKRVQLVSGTERNDPVAGTIPYSPSEIGQLNSAGVIFVSNPCPGGSYFGIRTGTSTSPVASTQPSEYWRLTMFIARSLDAYLGVFVGLLQSQQLDDDLRNQVKLTLNAFAQTLESANQIDSGIGFCEYSNAPTAKFGNGVNTPASVAQHYMYALFKATYLSSVWYFICTIQGGTTVVQIVPGQA